jgi:hypothetical protein
MVASAPPAAMLGCGSTRQHLSWRITPGPAGTLTPPAYGFCWSGIPRMARRDPRGFGCNAFFTGEMGTAARRASPGFTTDGLFGSSPGSLLDAGCPRTVVYAGDNPTGLTAPAWLARSHEQRLWQLRQAPGSRERLHGELWGTIRFNTATRHNPGTRWATPAAPAARQVRIYISASGGWIVR